MSVDIILNTATAPPTLFSFTDALVSAAEYAQFASNNDSFEHPPALYRQGCITDENQWNCTEACKNVSQIFSSTYTLQNCMAFPRISSLLADGSLTRAAHTTALEAGIDVSSYNASTTVHDSISKCLQGWCHKIPDCTGIEEGYQWCYDDAYGKRWCFSDPCSQTNTLVNPDIGGIGVISETPLL